MVQMSSQLTPNNQYLKNAISFLEKNQWIYNFKNTDILVYNVLANLSKKWAEYFDCLSVEDLHEIVRGNTPENAPDDFRQFVRELKLLSVDIEFDNSQVINKEFSRKHKLSKKKVHEIELLAPVINEVCQKSGCDLVVDIGSGIGYLPHLLYEQYNLQILALEASKPLIDTALTNQQKNHTQSLGHIIFTQLFVNENSSQEIESLIERLFGPNKKICLTGLHACADLSVDILKLFSSMKNALALVIMPCCYHRMTFHCNKFKNFPASQFLQNENLDFIGQPFMRLACQQTKGHFLQMSKEQHEIHARQCLQRAVLQLVAEMENTSVRRLKRKSGKSNEHFEDYLDNLAQTHQLTDAHRQISDDVFKNKMREKWMEYKTDGWKVEVLMGLQAAIQSICENVVLLDRLELLKEQGLHCSLRKITDDCLSPRCWAVVANKL